MKDSLLALMAAVTIVMTALPTQARPCFPESRPVFTKVYPARFPGSLDAAFQPEIASNYVKAVGVQRDGRIVVLSEERLLRLHSDGRRDASFSEKPLAFNSGPVLLRVLSDDDILFTKDNLLRRFHADGPPDTRLNRDGTLDYGFDVGGGFLQEWLDDQGKPFPFRQGGTDGALNLTLGPDGQVLVYGNAFTMVNGIPHSRLVRLHGGELQQPYILPDSPRRHPDRLFQFQVVGPGDRSVTIEAADKLDSPNWKSVATVVLGATPSLIKDSATNAATRYFRAVEQ